MRSTRSFVVVGLAVAFLVAGVVSYYASSHPDGLEYVASQTGFIDSADEHRSADSPLADYSVKGVDNARVTGGLAGVIGAGVTLLVMTALVVVVRRKHRKES